MEQLPSRAEVVVIGGGVVGASIAFHLAETGIEDVLLLERGDCACGSSSKPIGGVRAQFTDPLNIMLAARSLEAYERFANIPGADIGLDRVGYLFLLRTSDHVRRFEASVAVQNELGIPSRLITTAEALERCPYIDEDAFIAAAFSPTDGHARPLTAAAAYVEAARRHGARAVTGCAVTALDVEDGEIAAVHTSRGSVRTSTVVCAAGAWSREIGAMAGVDLPVEPVRRQIAFTPQSPGAFAPKLPFTIDYGSTFYFHNADDGLLLGMSDSQQAPAFDCTYTPEWLPSLRRLAGRCAPGLSAVELERGWAGLYELTPDASALIGESSSVGRFLYATGFSGHGFCHAPATGEVIRDLVLGEEPFVDVSPLRAERFAERAPIVEINIV
jgi:glycine/D-amino acid oxidase-like deaminating enzyme